MPPPAASRAPRAPGLTRAGGGGPTLSLPRAQKFSEEALEFQGRISHRNGLSDETYLPPSLHLEPPEVSMEHAREEARMVLFGAVTEVLERTGAAPLRRRAGMQGRRPCAGGRAR